MATTPIYGIHVPNLADSDNVPADLMALMTAIEPYFVGAFPSGTARAAAITNPRRGMVTWLDSTGRVEKYDGTSWGPVIVRERFTQAGGSRGAIEANVHPEIIITVPVPVHPFPYRVTVSGLLRLASSDDSHWRVLVRTAVTGGVAADPANGGTDIVHVDKLILKDTSKTFVLPPTYVEIDDGSAQDLVLMIYRLDGNGLGGVEGDPTSNRLDVMLEQA